MSKAIIPNVVRAGRTKKKELRALERGEGPLSEAVYDAVADSITELPDVDRDDVIPVVILYEEKPKRRRRRPAILWPLF